MIRRIIHELNVRALARRVVNAYHHNSFIDADRNGGCIILGPGHSGFVGAGFVIDDRGAELWPERARLLTIGRVTLAAWGGRPS
jgi:hypothetical protein